MVILTGKVGAVSTTPLICQHNSPYYKIYRERAVTANFPSFVNAAKRRKTKIKRHCHN